MRGVALHCKSVSQILSNLSWLLERWGTNCGNGGGVNCLLKKRGETEGEGVLTRSFFSFSECINHFANYLV